MIHCSLLQNWSSQRNGHQEFSSTYLIEYYYWNVNPLAIHLVAQRVCLEFAEELIALFAKLGIEHHSAALSVMLGYVQHTHPPEIIEQ